MADLTVVSQCLLIVSGVTGVRCAIRILAPITYGLYSMEDQTINFQEPHTATYALIIQ